MILYLFISYSASQVIGPPDVIGDNHNSTVWAPSAGDLDQQQFLHVNLIISPFSCNGTIENKHITSVSFTVIPVNT